MGLPRSFCDAPATSPTWTVDFYPTDGREVPKASKEGPRGATHKTQSPCPLLGERGLECEMGAPQMLAAACSTGSSARVEPPGGRSAYRGLPLGAA